MILRFTLRLALPVLVALALFIPATLGQAPTCEAEDISDSPTDHTNASLDAATGLNQIDMSTGCIAETETALLVTIRTAATPSENAARSLTFTFFLSLDGVPYNFRYDFSTTTATPALAGAAVSVAGPTVTLSIPRASVGSFVSDLHIESAGTFVTSTTVTSSTDRAPNTDSVFPSTASYRVGARAPGSVDSDGDGVGDRAEIANGTNPRSIDTDFDGLLDGASVEVASGSPEAANLTAAGILMLRDDGTLVQFAGEQQFGTNASHPDTDGDGLLDGANVTATPDSEAALYFAQFGLSPFRPDLFLGEFAFGAVPTTSDTDADGLNDWDEVTGARTNYGISAFFPEHFGSTNPADADTDDDGLTDGEEQVGSATVGGSRVNFNPTNPNGKDTDSDGLSDLEELSGITVDLNGNELRFPPTDPTLPDTDGDGYGDALEVAAGSDPTDPNSIPKEGGDNAPGGAEASYLWLSSVAMLVVGLLCVVGILVRWG
jgi:hypothetical protein